MYTYKNIVIKDASTIYGWSIKNVDELILYLIASEPFCYVEQDWLKNITLEQLIEDGGGEFEDMNSLIRTLKQYI